MTRVLRRLTTLVVPLLFATACSGGHGGSVPAGPSSVIPDAGHTRAVRDVTPADLHAGGTSALGLGLSGGVQPVGLASNIQQPLPSTTSILGNYGGSANVYYCQTQDVFAKQSFIGANTAAATGACAPLGSPSTGLGGRVDPVDFVGTVQALTIADYTAYKANREPTTGTNFGEPFEAPMSGSAIAFAYKPTDFPGLAGNRLKLSKWSYCAIANGTVTDWNDAAITADNGGTSVTGGTSLPITFLYRSDADGINVALQRHLGKNCNGFGAVAPYNAAPYEDRHVEREAKWTGAAASPTWTGPVTGGFTGVATNALLQQTIQQGHGAVGYVEAQGIPLSGKPHLSAATLQNDADYTSATPGTTFADPLVQTSVQDAFANVNKGAITKGGGDDTDGDNDTHIGTSRPECVLFVRPGRYTKPEAADAYPIVEVEYLAFVGANNAHLANDQTLLSYITSGNADATLVSDGYATLPADVKAEIATAVAGTKHKAPCIQ